MGGVSPAQEPLLVHSVSSWQFSDVGGDALPTNPEA